MRRHAVQIEIDRALYMNEQTIRPNGNFTGFQRLMSQIIADIVGLQRQELPVAAE